jgi:hypothetical protein
VVTPRRIQSPQHLPRGRFGEVVHLPAGTTGVGSFAPRARAQLGNLTSTRLDRRQPRRAGRLVVFLQLPLRDYPTPITTNHSVRFRWFRKAHPYPSRDLVNAVSSPVALFFEDGGLMVVRRVAHGIGTRSSGDAGAFA